MIDKICDFDHPLVRETALRLTQCERSDRGRIEKLFYYVRDDIKFGFPKRGDLTKASETIKLRIGQCNTKTTLFLALCKSLGIPARVHFSLIEKQIQRGLFPAIAYRLMPSLLSHSWIEVEVDGDWKRLDSYINDMQFYLNARRELKKEGWDTGYSIANSGGKSSADFNIAEERFVQMDAVVNDHGVWEEPAEYYASDQYRNRLGIIKMVIYRLSIKKANRRILQIRNEA